MYQRISGNKSEEMTVVVIEHPKGSLMRIEHDGSAMTLDRSEAFDLYEKLHANLGKMPVKIG